MVLYECIHCEFSSNIKTHYNRHLNTKKHILNKEKYDAVHKKSINSDQKVTILRPNSDQKVTILRPFSDHLVTNANKVHICQYCASGFSTKTHLYRHIRKYCKVIKQEQEEKEKLELIIKEEKEKHEKEKQELRDYIDKLIDKTANTTINIDKQLNQNDNSTNNNITLNNYGQEDISHITDQMKLNYIKLPFTGVQKMIEQVHFNKNKPENKNIAITNKKEKGMIKIYKDNRWRYSDRNEIIDQLIQINYGRIDDHYENEVKGTLSNVHNNRYRNFQYQFDNQQDKLIDIIKKDVEMIILSDNLS